MDAARKPLATYSGGMQRRLDLAMTWSRRRGRSSWMSRQPASTRAAAHTMWSIVRDLVARDTTVLLTTQNLDEADELADRIAVLDGGKIVAAGTPDELKRLVPGGHIRLRVRGYSRVRVRGAALRRVCPGRGRPHARGAERGGVHTLRAALDRLDAAGIEPAHLTIHTPDLDDVFFALTGRATEDTGPPRGSPHDHRNRAISPPPRPVGLGHDDEPQPAAHDPLSGLTFFVVAMPVVFLFLFVYVFGGTIGAGLPGGDGGRAPRRTSPTCCPASCS